MAGYSAGRLSLSIETVRACIARMGQRAYPMVTVTDRLGSPADMTNPGRRYAPGVLWILLWTRRVRRVDLCQAASERLSVVAVDAVALAAREVQMIRRGSPTIRPAAAAPMIGPRNGLTPNTSASIAPAYQPT